MTDLKLQISDDQLNAALQVAILKAVDDVGREEIIKHALNFLTAKKDNYRGKPSSPLMDIITQAAVASARKAIDTRLENDIEFKTEVDVLYTEAFQRCFGADHWDSLVSRLASAIEEALTSR